MAHQQHPWQQEHIEAAFWITIAAVLSLIVSVCVWLF